MFLFFPIVGQTNDPILDKKLDSIFKKSKFPGFAVAVVNESGIIFEKAYGFADVKNKKKYTLNTIQNIGSISKTIIGFAVIKSIELGYFDLETDANSILSYPIQNPNFPQNQIKIKHLVTHTSGILDNPKVYNKTFLTNKYSDKKGKLYQSFLKRNTIPNRTDSGLDDFLKNYLQHDGERYLTSNFNEKKPGEEYHYSNIASALAARLIEIKSGVSFEKFCEKYLFEPLHLKNTSFDLNDSIIAKHAKLYNGKMQSYPIYSAITYPDGGLKTSVHELAIYLQEMIKGYSKNSYLLSENSFQLLFQKQFDDRQLPLQYDKKEPNSGVFWRIKKDGLIGHSGSDLGITTFMFFDPETKIGKIFFTNIEFDNPDNDKIDAKLVQQFISVWKTLDHFSDKN